MLLLEIAINVFDVALGMFLVCQLALFFLKKTFPNSSVIEIIVIFAASFSQKKRMT